MRTSLPQATFNLVDFYEHATGKRVTSEHVTAGKRVVPQHTAQTAQQGLVGKVEGDRCSPLDEVVLVQPSGSKVSRHADMIM